jgi:hypothetical protein
MVVMDVLDRAEQQLLNAFEALDKPRPDHDAIKERIAGAMAAAQVVRARVVRDAMRLKLDNFKALVEPTEK